MENRTGPADIREVRLEHDSLQKEITDWRDWWQELSDFGLPHFGEMGTRLKHFREHLSSHFAHEEALAQGESGPLREQLLGQQRAHRPLLQELDELIENLTACEPAFNCWGDAKEQFETFLDRLDQHEDSEGEFWDQLV